jgi:hypothetical protein
MVELNMGQNLDKIDWTDSNELFRFAVGTIKIAEEYQKARKLFAISRKTLKIGLVTAYKNKRIETRIAEDKAYLLMAYDQPEMKAALSDLIDYEQEYKGLEKVLETRQAAVSLAQSLIKNRIDNV